MDSRIQLPASSLCGFISQMRHDHIALENLLRRRPSRCSFVDVSRGADGGARGPLRSDEEDEDQKDR